MTHRTGIPWFATPAVARALDRVATPGGVFRVVAVSEEDLTEPRRSVTAELLARATAIQLESPEVAIGVIEAGMLPGRVGLMLRVSNDVALAPGEAIWVTRITTDTVESPPPEPHTAVAVELAARGADLAFEIELRKLATDLDSGHLLIVPFPAGSHSERRPGLWAEACGAFDQVAPGPWIVRSAGESFERFAHRVAVACVMGASGFVVEAETLLADGNGEAALDRFDRLTEAVVFKARPWYERQPRR